MAASGPKPKSNRSVIMSAIGGKADMPQTSSNGSYWSTTELGGSRRQQRCL